MHSIKRDFWIPEKGNLLWSHSWDRERKLKLSQLMNQHWFLDKYSSKDVLRFLSWDEFLDKITQFKSELSKKWVKWLALDIDETLSLTSSYWFEKLLTLYWSPENLTAKQMADKYHLCQNVPYWKNNSEISDLMYIFREDNDFQIEIPIIQWTNTFYSKIHDEIISILSYITVRPDNVSDWTSIWLDNHNFPKADIIHIPSELEYLFWNLWKACVLDILYPHIVWIVDDNPSLIKSLPNSYPGEIFLFNTPESCSYSHVNVHISKTLDEVMFNIQKIFW